MRTFVFFALTLAGVAAVADDASAGPFRRNRGGHGGGDCCPAPVSASPCCGGAVGYGGGYAPTYGAAYGTTTPCCGSSVAAYPGGAYSSGGYVGGQWMGGQVDGQNVIQTTDGKVYVRGADGTYYASESGAYGAGFASQPSYGTGIYGGYSSPYRPGAYGTYRYPGGVYQSGYPGPYYYGPGVIPAGGTIPPLTMPGSPLPNPMPGK